MIQKYKYQQLSKKKSQPLRSPFANVTIREHGLYYAPRGADTKKRGENLTFNTHAHSHTKWEC